MKYRSILFLSSLAFLNACTAKDTDNHKITNIPEASGICYSNKTDRLFVVQDEGKIYQITTEGRKERDAYLGNYDLEGVACDDANHLLYAAVEGKESILVLDMNTFDIIKKVKIVRKYRGKTVIKKDKEHGIEGITLVEGELYLSNQSYNRYPHSDASILFRVKELHKKKTKIIDIIDHGFVDIAGLSYHKGYLYMVRDKKNLLIKYDLNNHKVVKKKKLPKFAQEGVTFDDKGFIYFADDEGAILKYKSKKFE